MTENTFMNVPKISFPLHHLLLNISGITRIIKKSVANHHLQVAHGCQHLSRALDWDAGERKTVVIAAMLHDIGMFSQKDKFVLLQSEFQHTRHAEIGARLVSQLPIYEEIEDIIRYHHQPWENDRRAGKADSDFTASGQKVPLAAHLVHFCDRISLLVDDEEEILNQRDTVLQKLEAQTPSTFNPEFIDLLREQSEHFWFSLVDDTLLQRQVKEFLTERENIMEEQQTLELGKFYSQVIDYRSKFTTTHSLGVAGTAERIGDLLGWSEEMKLHLRITGFFHDLGKLAVPPEIINKDDELTDEEYSIMKKHVFYSYQVLKTIPALEHIAEWAGSHHERLRGNGYPFGLDGEELSTPARVLAASDVFVALAEPRPYRDSMSRPEVERIMNSEAEENNLDGEIVNLLLNNYTSLAAPLRDLQKDRDKQFEKMTTM